MPESAPFPFETAAFHQCWQASLAAQFPIRFQHEDWCVVKKPVLKGLFGFHELRLAGWNTAWSQALTETRVAALATFYWETPWDWFRMTWRADHVNPQALSALERLGLSPVRVPGKIEYWVDLSAGFDGYMREKSRSNRKDIQQKLRRAEPLQPHFREFHGEDGINAFFEQFFAWHMPYWDHKVGRSYFHDPSERAFIVSWAKQLAQAGQLLLDGFYLGDRLANLTMSIVYPTALYTLLTINTDAYPEVYPGIVSLYQRFQRAETLGVQAYYMGAGDYPYKIQAANRQHTDYELLVPNPRSFFGKAYLGWLACRVKSMTSPSISG
jgi:hypothetical protein